MRTMAPEHHGHVARSLDEDVDLAIDAMCRRVIDALKPGEAVSTGELAYRVGESNHHLIFKRAVDRLLQDSGDGPQGRLERVGTRRLRLLGG